MSQEKITLGELIRLQRGFDLTEVQRRPGKVPIVGSAGIHGFHDTAKASGPGVTLGRSGASFGKVTFVREDFWPHNTTLFVTDFKGNDPAFVRYLLESMDFTSLNSGSAQQSLNRNFLYPVPVPKFNLPTQRKIAGILSAYDDLIENNLRRIKILGEMAQSLYREWFVHFRFPGHESARFVDSALGRTPEGWAVKKLGELADQMRRGVPKGKLDQPFRYVGLEHIPRQSLALDAWEETTELGSNKLTFERGDVLFGKIRPYFHKVSVAPFDGICSADTIVIRSQKPEHRALVTSCVFTEAFVAHATATSNGSKMPRTDWKVLKDYPLLLPPKTLLNRFSAVFEDSISQQQNLISRNQTLRQTRDLLLPKLLQKS
ncbi:MAG: restriction endonuclease subunit S [Opitutales bacterium]|nr:restriction endonuclease subunit S [Opitutales bacterium]